MLTIVTFVLIILAIALFAFAPWQVAVGGAIGGIIGAIAGSGAGIATGGEAANAWIFVGLVGFVVGGGLTYIGVLHRRVSEARRGIQARDDDDLSAGLLILGMVCAFWEGVSETRASKRKDKFIRRRGRGLAPTKRATPPAEKTGSEKANEDGSRSGTWGSIVGGLAVVALYATANVYGDTIKAWFQGWNDDSSPELTQDRQQPERVTQRNYERLVQDLGYTLPPIDPSSDQYDPAWVERIHERREAYVEQGYDNWGAFVAAVEDFSRPPEPAAQPERADEASSQTDSRSDTPTSKNSQPPSSTDSTSTGRDRTEGESKCVLKNVMSDADYRACGIDPP